MKDEELCGTGLQMKHRKPERPSQRKTHLSILDGMEAKSYRRAGAASGHIGNGTWTFIKITSNQSAFIVRWIGQMVKRKFSKQLARRLQAMTAIRRMGYMINGVLKPVW